MSLKLGNTDINKLYLGSTEIKQAYLGATEVFKAGKPFEVSLINNPSTGSGSSTSHTFSGVALGEEDDNRWIYVCVGLEANADIAGGTIAGETAELVETFKNTGVTPDQSSAILRALVPTGTTGNITITWDASTSYDVAIASYVVYGSTGVVEDSGTTSGTGSITIDIPAEGVGIYAHVSNTTTANTWTNATRNTSQTIGSDNASSATRVNATGSTDTTAVSNTAVTHTVFCGASVAPL